MTAPVRADSGVYIDVSGGSETRPVNAYVVYIIKATSSTGTILANRAVEEFAANSGNVTAAGGSNPASNTVYGPAGVPVIAVNSSTVTGWQQTKFDVQFQTQILPTDKISVELSSGNGVWYEAATDIPPVFQANAAYGILVRQINSTTVRVFFGNAGAYPTGATYGSASIDSWSGFTGHRWRVRKVSGGAAVGFPVSARNIVGDTSGTAVPAGMIGETLTAVLTSSINAIPADTLTYVLALNSLPKGKWLVTYTVSIDIPSGNTGRMAVLTYDVNAGEIPYSSIIALDTTPGARCLSKTMVIDSPGYTSLELRVRTGGVAYIYGGTNFTNTMTNESSYPMLTAVRIA